MMGEGAGTYTIFQVLFTDDRAVVAVAENASANARLSRQEQKI